MSEVYLKPKLIWNSYSITAVLVFYLLYCIVCYTIVDGVFRLLDFSDTSAPYFCAGILAGVIMTHTYKSQK